MSEKVLYFGYGANRAPEMMEAITGNKSLVGKPARLKGYELCVQRMDQVPDTVSETAPIPISPKKLVQENWTDEFTTYTIRPAEDKEVAGILWELTPEERELVRNWELIDFGWYKDAIVRVAIGDGDEVETQTEILGDGQKVDRVVDGRNYPPFLNELSDFQRIAQKIREEYLEILKSQEGPSVSGEAKS